MSRLERDRMRMERARKQARRRRVLKNAGALCAVVLAVVFCVWAVGAATAPKEDPAESTAASVQLNSSSSQAVSSLQVSQPLSGAGRRQAVSSSSQMGSSSQPESSSSEPEKTQLDDPLLVLVNDSTPLPEDWQVELRSVNDEEAVDARIYDDLMAMFQAAGQEDIWFWVASGYRSPEDQTIILDRGIEERIAQGMSAEEAEEDALRTIQRPGYSEHHTGLVVDLNDVSDGFEETVEYQWLYDHAAEYGFVQRYRSDKVEYTGIDNESWHYRYVGREHAQEMERLDMCLEEYVAYLRENGVS